MKIVGLVILAAGALISFGASLFVSRMKKRDATEKEILHSKLVGLLVAAIGLVVVMVS
ncbi:MAG: hypothetical protein J6K51_01115 [Clostridia bacterium]|nr:hypothetical protein [Clostridia bacterium]